MVFSEQFTFTGSLQLPGAEAQPVVAVLQQACFDPLAALKAHLIGCIWAPFWQNKPFPPELEIRSSDGKGRIILRNPTRIKLGIREAEVEFYDWTRLPGDESVVIGDRIQVEVELAAPGLLRDRRTVSYKRDGAVIRVQGTGDPELSLTNGDHTWTLGISYSNRPLGDDTDSSIALIPCPTIRTEWEVRADSNVLHIFSSLYSELRDLTRVLSFISRASTPWFLIKIDVLKKNGRQVCETGTRRVAAKQVRTGYAGPMFSQVDAARHFEQLLRQLAASPARNDLTRAIDFVVASWCSESMASALVLLHAALETTISASLSMRSLDQPNPSQLKKLGKAIRMTISDFVAEHGWSATVKEDLLEKSTEIKRPPIVRLICRLLPMLDVYTKDLWRDTADLQSEMRNAFAYRNNLVHAATSEESPEIQDRLLRLTLLTERVILRILGVKWLPAGHDGVYGLSAQIAVSKVACSNAPE